jgi:tryptophan synthase beta chain
MKDEEHQKKLSNFLSDYAGRPTPLYHAERLSEKLGDRYTLSGRIMCIRFNKLNNALARRTYEIHGEEPVILNRGRAARRCNCNIRALLDLCEVFMGRVDTERSR